MLISMGNKMVTSEIRRYFHARFDKILIISESLDEENYLNFDKSHMKLFLDFTSILYNSNIMGEKLHFQSWMFDLIIIWTNFRLKRCHDNFVISRVK